MPAPLSPPAHRPRRPLIGLRWALTLWIPVLLAGITAIWWVREAAVPFWWAAPALTAAGALLGDPVVRGLLEVARDTEAAEQSRRERLEEIRPDTVLADPAQRSQDDSQAGDEDPPPLRGGLVIGVLERMAVTVCLIGGFTAGVAVVVAIKGLARYGEFTSPSQREQFIIGTLASLLWASAAAGAIVVVSPTG